MGVEFFDIPAVPGRRGSGHQRDRLAAELHGEVVERALEPVEYLVDLGPGDDQRRREPDAVEHHRAADQPVALRDLHELRAGLPGGVEVPPRLLVLDELDGADQAYATHLSDQRVVLEPPAELGLEMRAHLAHVADDVDLVILSRQSRNQTRTTMAGPLEAR